MVNGNLEEPSIIENKKERKRIRFRPYTMDDFELRKVLGRGSFGKVSTFKIKMACPIHLPNLLSRQKSVLLIIS